ncbi:MAG: hypothetical protein R6U66_04825 [Bacteroidales bacterium]
MNLHFPSTKKLSSDKIVSIFAFVISMGTLFTFIYQTRIMQEHQRASHLPYLEVWHNNFSDKFEVILFNNGVGPAFITESHLTYKDSNYIFMYGQFFDDFDNSIKFRNTHFTPGRVIPAGEHVVLFGVYDSTATKSVLKRCSQIDFFIRYNSVFEESWTISKIGIPPKRVE